MGIQLNTLATYWARRWMMAVKPYHHLKKLQPKDAWLLLKKKVRKSVTHK